MANHFFSVENSRNSGKNPFKDYGLPGEMVEFGLLIKAYKK